MDAHRRRQWPSWPARPAPACSGQTWARVVAVIVAILSAFVDMVFLPAYPIWSAIIIAIDVLVIWAVTVHGSEVKTPTWTADTEVP